jgi:hypothetical protein
MIRKGTLLLEDAQRNPLQFDLTKILGIVRQDIICNQQVVGSSPTAGRPQTQRLTQVDPFVINTLLGHFLRFAYDCSADRTRSWLPRGEPTFRAGCQVSKGEHGEKVTRYGKEKRQR